MQWYLGETNSLGNGNVEKVMINRKEVDIKEG